MQKMVLDVACSFVYTYNIFVSAFTAWTVDSAECIELMTDAKQCTGIMCNGDSNQRFRYALILGVYYACNPLLTHDSPSRYNVNALHVFIVDFITLIMGLRCLAKMHNSRWVQHMEHNQYSLLKIKRNAKIRTTVFSFDQRVNNLFALNGFMFRYYFQKWNQSKRLLLQIQRKIDGIDANDSQWFVWCNYKF